MVKTVTIKIATDDSDTQVVTAWQTIGLSRDSIVDCFTLVGMLENTKNLINERIKLLMEKKL